MRYFIFLCYNLLHIYPDSSLSKPLGEMAGHIDEGSYSAKRIRRSIPEFDAVNPLYTDYDSLPNQEGSVDPQSAGFALSDQLSNIFRSQKSSKNMPKPAPKHAAIENAAVSLTRDINSIDGEYLRADEQEECYKQQNIVPPVVKESSIKRCSSSGVRNIPGLVNKERASFVRGNLLKEKSGKHFEEKEGEKTEITSLYSHPERAFKPRKVKHYPQPKTPDLFNTDGRVYKPIDMDAQFPIYDGDLDFQPDPLQGILDDKYWLDPQEQEAVIRKYMDVAANVVPPEITISKRGDPLFQDKVKSVDSKTGYKQSATIEERCPCKQVVACGECSKGKAGKKNITESYEEEASYGRKLLSVDYENNIEESRNDDAGEISSLEYENIEVPIKEGNNEETQIDELIPSVTLNDLDKAIDSFHAKDKNTVSLENVKESKNLIKDNNIYFGRKLLWIDEFNEFYEDVEDDSEEYADKSNSELSNENSYIDPKTIYHYDDSYPSASVYEQKGENPNIQHLLNFRNSEIQNSYHEHEHSNLYKPNKLANVLQKPLQKKPKGPPKTLPINTALEFEALENETLKNVTKNESTTSPEQTTVPGRTSTSENIVAPAQNKIHKKRWDENSRFGYKGRRRHADHGNTKTNVMAFAQNSDDLGGAGNKSSNKSESSPSTGSSLPGQIESTTSIINTGGKSNNTNDTTWAQAQKNFTKSVGEGVADSEVANNIVNSVLLESQKSSIVGHNLGLCRRNESLVKINYGRVVPETEKVMKSVTDCIMDRLRNHLAKQSCIILDHELLDFLKWMVLTGESYRDYKQRLPRIYDFLPPVEITSNYTTCPPKHSTLPLCDPGIFNPPAVPAMPALAPVAFTQQGI